MSTIPDHVIARKRAEGILGIDPWSPELLQPASYDLRLDRYFRTFGNEKARRNASILGVSPIGFSTPIDVKSEEDKTMPHEVPEDGAFELVGFALASTIERIRMPSHMVGRVEGKSSLARLGLFVHITAGFIDPGFEGHITLELFCALERGILLYPGMPVCQISFEKMDSESLHPYGSGATGSKYANQGVGPTPSRYWKNFR